MLTGIGLDCCTTDCKTTTSGKGYPRFTWVNWPITFWFIITCPLFCVSILASLNPTLSSFILNTFLIYGILWCSKAVNYSKKRGNLIYPIGRSRRYILLGRNYAVSCYLRRKEKNTNDIWKLFLLWSFFLLSLSSIITVLKSWEVRINAASIYSFLALKTYMILQCHKPWVFSHLVLKEKTSIRLTYCIC